MDLTRAVVVATAHADGTPGGPAGAGNVVEVVIGVDNGAKVGWIHGNGVKAGDNGLADEGVGPVPLQLVGTVGRGGAGLAQEIVKTFVCKIVEASKISSYM